MLSIASCESGVRDGDGVEVVVAYVRRLDAES